MDLSMRSVLLVFWLAQPAPAGADERTAVNQVLDDWHQAAAAAKLERYFSYLTPDAVFLGTDATERWTRDEFYRFCKPHFDQGKAWSFKARRRAVLFAPGGKVAWFDEDLETANLGPCRGSGVLIKQPDAQWKIAHYNLSVTVPNAAFPAVKKLLEGKSSP